MDMIDKKVLIKEAKGGLADLIYSVKNIPKSLLFQKNGKLHPGIKKSQTGDNGFLFERYDREGNQRLKTLDRYIEAVWPRKDTLPMRIPNQSVVGLGSSPALTKSQLEERLENSYGVRFLDLPIPRDENIPSFDNITESQHIIKTYAETDYYDPDQKEEPREKKEKVETPAVETDTMKCVGCGYQAKNAKALRLHIYAAHNRHKKKEAAAISSG